MELSVRILLHPTDCAPHLSPGVRWHPGNTLLGTGRRARREHLVILGVEPAQLGSLGRYVCLGRRLPRRGELQSVQLHCALELRCRLSEGLSRLAQRLEAPEVVLR